VIECVPAAGLTITWNVNWLRLVEKSDPNPCNDTKIEQPATLK